VELYDSGQAISTSTIRWASILIPFFFRLRRSSRGFRRGTPGAPALAPLTPAFLVAPQSALGPASSLVCEASSGRQLRRGIMAVERCPGAGSATCGQQGSQLLLRRAARRKQRILFVSGAVAVAVALLITNWALPCPL